MSQNRFVVSHDGVELGPFTKAVVLEKLNGGELDPVDYIYLEELEDWIMLAEFQTREEANSETMTPTTVTAFRLEPVETDPDHLDVETEVSLNTSINIPIEEGLPPLPELPEEPNPGVWESTVTQSKATLSALEHEQPTQINDGPEEELNGNHFTKTSIDTSLPPKTLHLENGVGVLEVPTTQAGRFQIQITNPLDLELDPPVELLIKSGTVEKVEIDGPSEILAGQSVKWIFRAVDEYANTVQIFSDETQLKWNPSNPNLPSTLKFHEGIAELSLNLTLADSFELAMEKLPSTVVQPPQKTIQVKAGPAKRLKVESPNEALAGQPVQIRVQAVDEFGNPTQLDREIEVEIKTA